jgi:hypothetical protein
MDGKGTFGYSSGKYDSVNATAFVEGHKKQLAK